MTENGDCIAPNNGEEHEQEPESEITVKQDEDSIELQYDGELDHDQILPAEVYSILFSLGGTHMQTWLGKELQRLSVQLRRVRRRPIMMMLMEMTMLDPTQR